jgi:hypothetical protein
MNRKRLQLEAGALGLGLLAFTQMGRVQIGLFAGALFSLVAAALVGAYLLRWLLPQEESRSHLLVFGAVLGLSVERAFLIPMAMIVNIGSAAISLAALGFVVAVVAILRSRQLEFRCSPTGISTARAIIWLAILLLVPISLAYFGVGAPTARGYAFSPYFNHDYLQHASIVAELTKGLLPENPYFSGEPLHYYWFFHLWPAGLSSATGTASTQALTATTPLVALVFAAALFLALDSDGTARPRFLACALALFAPSYIGVLSVARLVAPELLSRIPGVGAADYSLLSHSWFRDSLYEPHALTALSILLTALYLGRCTPDRNGLTISIVRGILGGLLFLCDALIALVGAAFLGLRSLLAWQRGERSVPALVSEAAAAAATVLGVIASGALPVPGTALQVAIHPMAKVAPLYLLVELGPLAVAGAWGIVLCIRSRGAILASWRDWALLCGLSLGLTFFLLVPNDPNTALRKGLKVMQIALVAFAVAPCAEVLARRTWRVAAAPLVLLGALTVGTDLVHYLRLAGASSTTYVSAAEWEVLAWIRRCSPRTAVFQDVSEVRPNRAFKDTFHSMIASLGERRTLFGSHHQPYIMRVDATELTRRRDLLLAVFGARQPQELQQGLAALPSLDLLYADRAQPGPHAAIEQLKTGGLLRQQYCSGPICIFAVSSVPTPCAPPATSAQEGGT